MRILDRSKKMAGLASDIAGRKTASLRSP